MKKVLGEALHGLNTTRKEDSMQLMMKPFLDQWLDKETKGWGGGERKVNGYLNTLQSYNLAGRPIATQLPSREGHTG